MERKELHQKIADLTDLISVNNDRLFLHDDKIAQLEIDLLRKNAIELYEQINLLHITNLRVKEEATLTRAENDSEAIKVEKELEADEKEEPAMEAEEKTVEEVVVAEEETKEAEPETPEIEETPEKPEEKVIPEIIEEKPQPQTKLFEVIEEKKEAPKAGPIAGKPGKEGKTHIYEKYRQSKIDSIKKSISILKKYEYQNQLFGKDPKAYTEAIEMLDQAASMDVALSLFENSLAKKYHWPEDDSLVEELRELVLRRHS